MKPYLFWIFLVSSPSIDCVAQIPVREEPRHKNVFENGIVRVLDVWIQPGDTSLYHRHETPSLFIFFTNSKIGSQMLNESKEEGMMSESGESYYDSFAIPEVHRVWNADLAPFHVMDVEILTKDLVHDSRPLQNPKLELKLDEKRARIYGLKVLQQTEVNLATSVNPILIVVLKGELILKDPSGKSIEMHSGSFYWTTRNTETKITNMTKNVVECKVFEIKL